MKVPRFVDLPARILIFLFFLLTSAFCLLAYIPFTFQQVVAGELFPWLSFFARFYGWFYWGALALIAFAVFPDFRKIRNSWARATSIGFLGLLALAGIAFVFWSPLGHLRNNHWALVGSVLALLPLLWVATVEVMISWTSLEWAGSLEGEEQRVFYAGSLSAIALAFIYTASIFVRHSFGWTAGLDWKFWPLYLDWTLASHLLVFVLLFLAVDFVASLSRLTALPSRTEFVLLLAMTVALLCEVIRVVVFIPLSFTGIAAALTALAFAAAISVAAAWLSLRIDRTSRGPFESGLEVLISPIRTLRRAPWLYRVCFLLMIPGIAFYLAIQAAAEDWGFMSQQFAALFIWILTFACLYALLPAGRPYASPAVQYAVGAVIFLGYLTLLPGKTTLLAPSAGPSQRESDLVRQYSDFDISYRVAYEILTGSAGGSLTGARDGNQFFSFLTENAAIPQSSNIKPVPVHMVKNLLPTQGLKPNIFIIVIDSLRRDYVSAYNPSVWFTPSIGSFARDSVVMKNAFTQYGGTALSEPCIWAGAQLLHQEYTQPFYPMNALDQLLEKDSYQSYVSVDSILRVILDPAFPKIQLDKGRGTMDLRLGPTLKELETKLNQRPESSQPIFLYTQSQDIHVSVIDREGRSVPPGWSSAGFDPAVASRLNGVDRDFGEFIDFLKLKGLYDNSIIILTADHGDDLGEGGRLGHAYYIFPEIMRVPLIIHLPPAIQSKVWFDPTAITFLTDIAPSLYYLLGERPIERNGIFGRPLFTEERAEQTPYLRNTYLMVSSYGPVYGILRGGDSLYIADAINYRDYLFSLGGGPDGVSLEIRAAQRTTERAEIIRNILAVGHYYGFHPTRPAAPVGEY